MSFNPRKETDLVTLRQAITSHREALKSARDNRIAGINQLVGAHYGPGDKQRMPVNMLAIAVAAFGGELAAQNPRVLITSPHWQLSGTADIFELATNHLLTEITFADALRQAVMEAMFGMGIIKCGLDVELRTEAHGFTHDVGQPYADCVPLDDWVQDMTATRWDQVQFCGNRYRLPADIVKESEFYDKKARAWLKEHVKAPSAEPTSEPRSEDAAAGTAVKDAKQITPMIQLWDVWVPSENMVVTISDTETTAMPFPLRTVEWQGPEGGPYQLLKFGEVPGNIWPLPPLALWRDLNELGNDLFRKLQRQAQRAKKVGVSVSGNDDDVTNLMNAADGDVIRSDADIVERVFGGVDQMLLAMFLQVKRLFSYVAGNLDAVAGLAPMSETLGQDQLLYTSAHKRVQDMQGRTLSFVTSIVKSLGYYLWTDPLIEMPLVKRLDNIDVSVPLTFTPEQREGDFLDYNLNIDPYSLRAQTPSTNMQAFTNYLTYVVGPFIPLLQQQGAQVNFEVIQRFYSKFSNVPEINEVIIFGDGAQSAEGGPVMPPGSTGGPQPPVTKHISERHNRGGSGADESMMQLMAGQNPAAPQMTELFKEG